MIYGLYLSAAGMQSSSHELDVIANNLANANTTGFKHELAILSERRVETDESGRLSRRHGLLDDLTGGVGVEPPYTTFSQGPMRETGRPLDVAIRGQGFIPVLDGEDVRYTRDGRFTMGKEGRLTTVTGTIPVDANGRPILLDPQSTARITISADGVVRQGPDEMGRLGLVNFEDPQRLTKTGGGLFDANDQMPRPSDGEMLQGYVEESTVDPVATLTQMILAQRTYQMNATMISLQDGMLSRAVNELGKVS